MVCVPVSAEAEAMAERTLAFDETTESALSPPRGSAIAKAADCRLVSSAEILCNAVTCEVNEDWRFWSCVMLDWSPENGAGMRAWTSIPGASGEMFLLEDPTERGTDMIAF